MATAAPEVAAPSKSKTEYFPVKMTDGRTVQFAGKRKVNKETVIDESKIAAEADGSIVQFEPGAISIRMDFRNGETRLIPLPLSLLAKFAGHGGEQKFGDELATPADKPLSEEDMVLAIDALDTQIQAGKWGVGRAAGGGGVSGAGIVVQAVMEATGKDLATVKAYFAAKVAAEALKPEDQRISLRDMYNSFRVAGTKTGVIVARLEAEKLAKSTKKLDANAELANVGA